MGDLGLRIVEVEPAPCRHLHASNYDPAKVVQGQPIEVLGDGRMWCYDCKEFFTHGPLPLPRYTLKEIEALAREFIDDYPPDNSTATQYQYTISTFLAWLARREREGRTNVD